MIASLSTWIGVAVAVGVSKDEGVSVAVAVGVSVAVSVGVPVDVSVGVPVGVLVGVSVGVSVGEIVLRDNRYFADLLPLGPSPDDQSRVMSSYESGKTQELNATKAQKGGAIC